MNSKLAKELRRVVAVVQNNPERPVSRLLAKPVRLKDGGDAIIAINARDSQRGAYLALKAAVEKHPEILEQIRATMRYKQMLKSEQASGGPTFVR